MAKGAVAALDKANIPHGVGKDVIVMGFDCNKWALEELLNQNWNYDGQCNPFQASYIDDIIKKIEGGTYALRFFSPGRAKNKWFCGLFGNQK